MVPLAGTVRPPPCPPQTVRVRRQSNPPWPPAPNLNSLWNKGLTPGVTNNRSARKGFIFPPIKHYWEVWLPFQQGTGLILCSWAMPQKAITCSMFMASLIYNWKWNRNPHFLVWGLFFVWFWVVFFFQFYCWNSRKVVLILLCALQPWCDLLSAFIKHKLSKKKKKGKKSK